MRTCWPVRRCRSLVSSNSTPTSCTTEGVLRIQLRQGLSLGMPDTAKRRRAMVAVADGLLKSGGNRLVLADRGRLLGDAVVGTLLA
jgi:hypothetical protein